MNDDFDKGWLAGFYSGIEAFGETWEEFVDLVTTSEFDKVFNCSYCSDTGVNYITPEMCSPGKYTTSVVKCRRCNGECGPDYEAYMQKIIQKTVV